MANKFITSLPNDGGNLKSNFSSFDLSTAVTKQQRKKKKPGIIKKRLDAKIYNFGIFENIITKWHLDQP